MNTVLNNFSEIVAKANDLFYSKFEKLDTLMGIMDKSLRNKGMRADAITIDCVILNKKIVFLLHDDKPDFVNVTLGNKEGDIYASSEYELTKLSQEMVLEVMETYFTPIQ
jgi:hypothetical protein